MPVIPRNTITQTRIAPIPGVQTVTPRGAEAIGAVASAIGRQADAVGEQARSNAQEIRAWQGALGAVGDAAVTMQRIQDMRDARDVDQTEIAAVDFLRRTTNGHDDPATGQHVPGTYDAPYDPEGKAGEPTSAVRATSKAFRDWMDDEKGPFSKLTPRAQDQFRRRFSAKYRVFEDAAIERDNASSIAMRKALDEAAAKSNLDLLQQAQGNDEAFMKALPAATEAETMRVMRNMLADPSVSTLAEAKWKAPGGERVAAQVAQDFQKKAATDHAGAYLQMAASVPIGTPEDDAKAEAILANALSFSKGFRPTGSNDPALTPEQVAKVEEAVQSIRHARIRQKATIENQNIDDAKEWAVHFARTGKDYDKYQAARSKLTEGPALSDIDRFITDHREAEDMAQAEAAWERFEANPTPTAEAQLRASLEARPPKAQNFLRERIARQAIDQGQSRLQAFALAYRGYGVPNDEWDAKMIPALQAGKVKEFESYLAGIPDETVRNDLTLKYQAVRDRFDTDAQQASDARQKAERERGIAMLETGATFRNGKAVILGDLELAQQAQALTRQGILKASDYTDFMKKAKERKLSPENVQNTVDAFKSIVNVADKDIEALFRFDTGTDSFRTAKVKGKRAIEDDATLNVTVNGKEGELTARVLRRMLNLAVQFQANEHVAKQKGEPTDLRTLLTSYILKADDPDVQALQNAVAERELVDSALLIRNIEARQRMNAAWAVSGPKPAAKKGTASNAND